MAYNLPAYRTGRDWNGDMGMADAVNSDRLYAQSHMWFPSPSEECYVSTEPFATPEEADAALRETLKEMRYRAPRWWEYWRWKEADNRALRDWHD